MPTQDQARRAKLKIAVIGGGRRCMSMLNMIRSRTFKRLSAEIVGVADLNPEAPGIHYARDQGIYTTDDCARLFELEDLDLVIELTDDDELLANLAASKPESVGIIGHTASRLFHDIVAIYQQLEEKREEVSLVRSFSQALINATSEGVMVLDPDYHILRINQAALRAAGLTQDEALGRFCFQVTHQAVTSCDSPDTPCPMKSTLATGKSAHAIHEHRQSDGSSHYCYVSTYPLFNRSGELVHVLEILQDITDDLTRRVEHRAEAIKADLARLVQEDKLIALGKLVASVAHEINNPIASILNFVKFIKKGLAEGQTSAADLADYDRYLGICADEVQRCSHIVGNLLSFARQNSKLSRLVNLADMIQVAIQLTDHRMQLSNIELKVDLPPEGLMVWGDQSQLQQVVLNLIFNAMEAMEQGGELVITGGVDQEQDTVWLEFSDSGAGISAEDLPNIFEPFFSTKADGSGVGLGLSMVYGILREHKGLVEVSSQPGQGATFRVILPRPSQAQT